VSVVVDQLEVSHFLTKSTPSVIWLKARVSHSQTDRPAATLQVFFFSDIIVSIQLAIQLAIVSMLLNITILKGNIVSVPQSPFQFKSQSLQAVDRKHQK
jgi:hypothetical protein